MADLIFARGVNDLSREMPFYVNMLRVLDHQNNHTKPPFYGSIYVMNVCNCTVYTAIGGLIEK